MLLRLFHPVDANVLETEADPILLNRCFQVTPESTYARNDRPYRKEEVPTLKPGVSHKSKNVTMIKCRSY